MCVLRRITKDDDFVGVLARKVREWRNPKFTEHSIKEMMDQRVLQIAAGYEDADDCDLLRKDGMMKLMVGRLPSGGDLCSQPTMTRLENHVQHKELYDMGWAFVRHLVESYDKEPVKIILDLDDSNANCYGAQQLSVFNGYYGEYCYMPLFIFEGFSGKLVVPILRPGRTNKRDRSALGTLAKQERGRAAHTPHHLPAQVLARHGNRRPRRRNVLLQRVHGVGQRPEEPALRAGILGQQPPVTAHGGMGGPRRGSRRGGRGRT